MIVLDYQKKYHKQTIHACVAALKQGKVLAYPTDTSYGLAVDATNIAAIKKLYQVKGRNFDKPVHVVVPSAAYAKKVVKWGKASDSLSRKFFPGALTLVLPLRTKNFLSAEALAKAEALSTLSANTGFMGVRMPNNQIALDLAKYLKRPITATSANISGEKDCYSASDIIKQFKNQNHKPDIIINAGKLLKTKPSAVVKITGQNLEILRAGPITQKQISNAVKF